MAISPTSRTTTTRLACQATSVRWLPGLRQSWKRQARPRTRKTGSKPAPPRKRSGLPTSDNALCARRCTMRCGGNRCCHSRPPSKLWLILPSKSARLQVFRCRRRAGQWLPDRRRRSHRRHIHRDWRVLHGICRQRAAGSALADKPRYGIAFCGDGSFMMNPQILIDAVEHGVRGMIVIFDNRRMAAITGLQLAQYQTGIPYQRSSAMSTTCEWLQQCPVFWPRTQAAASMSYVRLSRSRTLTMAFLSFMCRSISDRTNLVASGPGGSGTSATGATTCKAPGSSRICERRQSGPKTRTS